jgi:hypothetical protein
MPMMDMIQTMWKADSSAIQYCFMWVSLISDNFWSLKLI